MWQAVIGLGTLAVTGWAAFFVDNSGPDVVISQPPADDGELQSTTKSIATLAVIGLGVYAGYKIAKR